MGADRSGVVSWFLLMHLLVQLACADVVFEQAGEGAGGSGSASGSESGGVSEAEGGGPPDHGCQAFCQANVDLCDDELEPCLRQCRVAREHFGRCTDRFDAYVDCLTPTSEAACDAPLARCDDPGRELEECTYPPGGCGPFVGDSPWTVSGTTRTCGDVVYATICEGELATGATCTCVVDDDVVGACREELNLFTGECCVQFFAEGGSR